MMCFDAQTPRGCEKLQTRLCLAKYAPLLDARAVSKRERADGDDPAHTKPLCKCCMLECKRVNDVCLNKHNFVTT